MNLPVCEGANPPLGIMLIGTHQRLHGIGSEHLARAILALNNSAGLTGFVISLPHNHWPSGLAEGDGVAHQHRLNQDGLHFWSC